MLIKTIALGVLASLTLTTATQAAVLHIQNNGPRDYKIVIYNATGSNLWSHSLAKGATVEKEFTLKNESTGKNDAANSRLKFYASLDGSGTAGGCHIQPLDTMKKDIYIQIKGEKPHKGMEPVYLDCVLTATK
jgi:hypothetical protein